MCIRDSLCDALGAALDGVQVAIPLDIEARLGDVTPEVQAAIRATIVAQVRESLAPHAEAMFCNALRSYRDAIAEGVGSQRAIAQIEAYGPELAAHCGL